MKNDYSDIIGLPVHEPDPDKHPRMSREARAAQFAPFAALTGFEQVVDDAAEDVMNKVINETVFEDIEDI